MKKSLNAIISFFLFLNLYIILTYFWDLSGKLYHSTDINSFVLNIVPFCASLLIVLRHAQIIEISFDISKQSEYAIGIIGLTLPLITAILQKNISIFLFGYILASLLIFEIVLLAQKGAKINFFVKLIVGFAWLILFLQDRAKLEIINYVSVGTVTTIIILIISLLMFYELYVTCISMPSHMSDRYDLYMLAYFSVAGVLFNYCSEHIAKNKIENIDISNVQISEIVLFVFWIAVLVRIIQSLHLAALDYQDTQVKGLDLAILSIFYIFITTYWLLSPEKIFLYGSLCILSFFTSCYFAYMRFVRIKGETTINIIFDNRIQSVNCLVFAIISIVNGYMYFFGYSNYLFFIQIVLLLFNIFHSHSLTMWVKFDLLFNCQSNLFSIKHICKNDIVSVSSILNYNFCYIFGYAFNTLNSKKKTRRLIYLLLSSGSFFGIFGMSHFFWIVDIKTNENIGIICIRSKYNTNIVYSILSLIVFLMKYCFLFEFKCFISGIVSLAKKIKYIYDLDFSDESESIEISYIVINKNKRRKGYAKKIIDIIKKINERSLVVYPKKHQIFNNISLVVREKNSIAILMFNQVGFCQVGNGIKDPQFESATKKGCALVMKCPIDEVRIFE